MPIHPSFRSPQPPQRLLSTPPYHEQLTNNNMPFFRHFFHLFNIVLRLRAGIPIPAEPTRDMGTLRRIQRSTNLQELVGQVSGFHLSVVLRSIHLGANSTDHRVLTRSRARARRSPPIPRRLSATARTSVRSRPIPMPSSPTRPPSPLPTLTRTPTPTSAPPTTPRTIRRFT